MNAKEKFWKTVGPYVCQGQFKPIHAEFWQDFDAWDRVQVIQCYRFKDGFVQLARNGYWFPYQGEFTAESLFVNLVKPHVLV